MDGVRREEADVRAALLQSVAFGDREFASPKLAVHSKQYAHQIALSFLLGWLCSDPVDLH